MAILARGILYPKFLLLKYYTWMGYYPHLFRLEYRCKRKNHILIIFDIQCMNFFHLPPKLVFFLGGKIKNFTFFKKINQIVFGV
jgi:hypothetical protein